MRFIMLFFLIFTLSFFYLNNKETSFTSEIFFLIVVFAIFFVFSKIFFRKKKSIATNFFIQLIKKSGKPHLKEEGKKYTELLKKECIEKANFSDLKDFYRDPCGLNGLFDEIILKKEGLTTYFFSIIYLENIIYNDIKKIMEMYNKSIIELVDKKALAIEKNMIRGTCLFIFPSHCPAEARRRILNELEAKDIKYRIHLIPLILDLEKSEIYPPVEKEYKIHVEYPPGREFIEKVIFGNDPAEKKNEIIDEKKRERSDDEKFALMRRELARTIPYVTWCILFINMFLWLIMETYGGTENPDILFMFGANEKIALWQGEYWRLISSVFIHIGLLHILGNSLFLYLCGPLLEKSYGHEKFLIIYMLSGFTGSIFSLLGMKITESVVTISAGASGALFGILGGLISFTVIAKKNLPARLYRSLIMNLLLLVSLNLLINLIIPGIDMLAHIGGLFAGLFLGYLLQPEVMVKKEIFTNKFLKPLIAFIFLLSLVFSSLIALTPPHNLPFYIGTAHLKEENFTGAEEAFKKASAIEPERADIYFNLGLSYLGQDRQEPAMKELEKSLELDPDNYRTNFFIGVIYQDMGELDKALNYYKETVRLNKNFAFAYESMGDLYRLQNKWDLSIENCQKAIDLNFLLPSAHSTLGWVYLYQKNLKEAESEFDLAMNLSGNNDFKALAGISSIQAYRGEFENARQTADDLKTIDDYSYWGYLLESEIYRSTGEFEKAKREAKFSLSMKQDYYYPYFLMGKIFFCEGRPKEASPYLSDAVKLNCREPECYELLAMVSGKSGLPKKWEENYSDKSLINLFMAYCSYYEGNLKKADREITDLISKDNTLIESYLLKALILFNEKNMSGAKNIIQKSGKIDPYNDRLIYFKGYLYYLDGKERKARENFRLIQDMSSPLTYCARAFEFYMDKNYDKACEQAELSLRGYKTYQEGHLLLAMIAEKKGNSLKALMHYKIVLKNDSNRIEAKEFIEKEDIYSPYVYLYGKK